MILHARAGDIDCDFLGLLSGGGFWSPGGVVTTSSAIGVDETTGARKLCRASRVGRS